VSQIWLCFEAEVGELLSTNL